MLLAVDPGKHRSGWALFGPRSGGLVLFFAGYDPPSKTIRAPDSTGSTFMPEPDILVIERPQVYRAGKSKGDPNDLVDVAIAAGRWIGTYPDAALKMYAPADWKGQLSKVKTARRAHDVLTQEERERCPALPTSERAVSANTWDAIALGLVHLGRLRMR